MCVQMSGDSLRKSSEESPGHPAGGAEDRLDHARVDVNERGLDEVECQR